MALVARTYAHVEHTVDGCRMNANADFPGARLGIRHCFVFENVRRAVIVDEDRFHVRACVTADELEWPTRAEMAAALRRKGARRVISILDDTR